MKIPAALSWASLGFAGLCSAQDASSPGGPPPNGTPPFASVDSRPVRLDAFVVESSSAPAVLRLSFRHHLIWGGIDQLTFTEVPASWARAGIRVGDHLVSIDGAVLHGMGLLHDFGPLMHRIFDPLLNKTTEQVFVVLEAQSDGESHARRIPLAIKARTPFTVFSSVL